MAETDDRIRCRYCGSNNFPGAASCWQCNRPLIPTQSASPAQSSVSQSPTRDPISYPTFDRPADTAAGDRAAIALGLLFPVFGYPIGLAFIMLDNPRKAHLGRLAILWSTIGLVLSLVLSIVLMAPLAGLVKQALPSSSMPHMSLPGDGLDDSDH